MKFINAHYVEYTPDKWLSYDDVSLIPLPSNIDSRNDPSIDLSTNFTKNLKLKNPIISANMDTVTESDMVIAMANQGAYGILHRFYSSNELFLKDVEKVYKTTNAVAFSIGLAQEDFSKVDEVLNITGGSNTVVTIDVAHGHLNKCVRQVRNLRKTFGDKVQIIAGNVCTPIGVADLINAGADSIKVNISNGSMCSTRIVTGFGVPALSAIMMARKTVNAMQTNTALIADGGIRNSGDIVKALAAGADTVMIGNLFAATDEAPGEYYIQSTKGFSEYNDDDANHKTVKILDGLYKKYRGQSSANFLEEIGKTNVSVEGEHHFMPVKGSVKPILAQLIAGIRSGMTYAGATNLEELSENAMFAEISYHGYIEGTPHGKSNT